MPIAESVGFEDSCCDIELYVKGKLEENPILQDGFTELKIDQSFVASCETDEEAWKIIRATISLARELGLSVVAEGIETESVETKLRNAGCQIGQGWRFGRAMSERMLHAWL